jgi:drug/metabolite transporter (DMT)-like permease
MFHARPVSTRGRPRDLPYSCNGPLAGLKMTAAMTLRETTIAKIACAYGGFAWGVFWLPLRILDANGISGTSATFVFYAVPLLFISPLLIMRLRHVASTDLALHVAAALSAISMVLYGLSFLYTDVVRAMLLYYMTPIWGALLARAWLKERITPARVISFVFGFAGLLTILSGGEGLPLPKNAGDWISLSSSVLWAVAMVVMRNGVKGSATDLTLAYFVYGSLFALTLMLLPGAGTGDPRAMLKLFGNLFWLVPIIATLVVPTVFSVMWGSPKLNPGTVGILFMTEISAGAITAWLWSGESFGLRELAGVTLITGAGLTETILELPALRAMKASAAAAAGGNGEN